jgi:hypothetical protein
MKVDKHPLHKLEQKIPVEHGSRYAPQAIRKTTAMQYDMSTISSIIFLFFEFHISKIRAGQLRICMSRRIAKKYITQLAL